jgi:Putative Flp pilus-assembly TadE/G-like
MDETTRRSRRETGRFCRRDFPASRRGQILPLFAVTLIGVIAVVALAIDGGSVQRERRIEQNAADAGAQAGAAEIMRTQSVDVVRASAFAEATRNGFTNGVNGVTVAVTHPIVSGEYFIGDKYVKVEISRALPTFFAAVVGKSSMTVRAKAIGGIITPSGYCLVALETGAYRGLLVDGGATLSAENCNIAVRATGSEALCLQNPPSSLSVTGGTISVAASAGTYTGCALTPTTTPSTPLQTGVTSIQDPLSYLTMPSYSPTCLATNKTINGSQIVTLDPGTYCGGIRIQNTAQVSLNPGVYTLLGGGLRVENNSFLTSLPGGVTFINTWDGSHPYVPYLIQSGTTINLTANTTAVGNTMPGILFYGDKTWIGQIDHFDATANDIQSGATSTINGALYFPTQLLELHSGSTQTITGAVVAKQIWAHGSGTRIIGGGGGGSGFFSLKRPSVVE